MKYCHTSLCSCVTHHLISHGSLENLLVMYGDVICHCGMSRRTCVLNESERKDFNEFWDEMRLKERESFAASFLPEAKSKALFNRLWMSIMTWGSEVPWRKVRKTERERVDEISRREKERHKERYLADATVPKSWNGKCWLVRVYPHPPLLLLVFIIAKNTGVY